MAKLAFIWPFNQAKEIYPKWRDGLRAAIQVIEKEHTVDWFLGDDFQGNSFNGYDAILTWTDSQDRVVDSLPKKVRKGIILTTMPYDIENLKKYQIVFCESKPVLQVVRQNGLNGMHAFGTDTDFFSPDEKVKKDILYFYPATFSPWKRQRDIVHLRNGLWCIGTVQPDGAEDLEACQRNGVHVEIGYFDVDYILSLYRRAENIPIPAVHGSERTVLEAMSLDLLPQVNPENHKAYSFVNEFINSYHESPRAFVLSKYSHKRYAKRILEGLRIGV